MVTLHDTQFVEYRWLDYENCRHLTVVGLHDTSPSTPYSEHSRLEGLRFFCWLNACLASQPCAGIPRGWSCSDNFTCCHTETEVPGQTFYLTQSLYTGARPASPNPDPISPGAWKGNHRSTNDEVTGMARAPGRGTTGVPMMKSLVWLGRLEGEPQEYQ